jgi:predicted DNA-binding transcriptional regulator AlpA
MEQLINEAELAKKLGKGRRTVQRWRLTGKGPPYHRIGGQIRGRVMYKEEDVAAWLAQHRQGATVPAE